MPIYCPKCGTEASTPTKSWELKPKGKKPTTIIEAYVCPNCKLKFRFAKSIKP